MTDLATSLLMLPKIIKKSSNIEVFKELALFNSETTISRWVCVDEFENDYQCLKLGNGGGWCRLDGDFGKKYMVCTAKKNGQLRFSWDKTEEQEEQIRKSLSSTPYSNNFDKGVSIYLIKICGIQDGNSARPIGKNIRSVLEILQCVTCGSNSNIEIDHKNGLYNNPLVLKLDTQVLSDFQPLCKHCNDQKRQTYVQMRKTGTRHKATAIPCLSMFGVDYIKGNESFDLNDPDTMIGTYWYDPVQFMNELSCRK